MSPTFPRRRFSFLPLVCCGTAAALFASGCASSGAPPSKTASGAGTGAMIGGTGAALAGIVAPNSSMNSGAAIVGGAAAGAIIGGAIGAIQQARSNREQDLLAQERAYNAEQSKRRTEEAKQKLALEEELAVRKGFLLSELEMSEAERHTAEAQAALKKLQDEYQTAYNKTKKYDELIEKRLAAEAEAAKMEEQIKRLREQRAPGRTLEQRPQARPGQPTRDSLQLLRARHSARSGRHGGQVNRSRILPFMTVPRPAIRTLMRAAAFLAGLGAAGCTSTYKMKVDTSSAPIDARIQAIRRAPSGDLQAYQLRDKSAGAEGESLRGTETLQLVRAALNGRGLYEVTNILSADMLIDVEYGMDKPKTHMEQMQVPVYAQNGGGVIYGQRQITSAIGGTSTRTVPALAPPGTQLVGYEDILVPVTTYEKFIRLSAREARAARDSAATGDLWSVSITSDDESNDLRKYLPLLASALVGYVGADSTVQRTIKLSPKDPTIGLVKQGP